MQPRRHEDTKKTILFFGPSCLRGKRCSKLICEAFGLLLGSRDLPAGRDDLGLAIDRNLRRLDEPRDDRRRVVDLELLHEEREALLQRLSDGFPDILAEIPHAVLEWTERLLARFVDELLLGVLRLALFGGVLAQPRVHLGLEVRRILRVLVD